ncbi:YcaO-like family protein [Isoptericola sp. AK164]|uniref:YcaO-like family protein n=1 Tax=Isoptericola sp. AK164 TaxID=3024246 RepID=UPI00241821FF|nr:YcaO-like family protein [Isoptericola sp. AK164]
MRLTVHRLGDDRVLVCRNDGRRWVLDVGADELDGDAARSTLNTLAAPDGSSPVSEPPPGPEVVAASQQGLAQAAVALDHEEPGDAECAVDHVVRWPFAGSTYRIRLTAGRAVELADTISALLRATIPDPEQARALVEEPVAIVAGRTTGAASSPDRRDPGPAGGVLERWTDGAWHPHAVDPPAVVDPVTGLLHRVARRPADPRVPRPFVHRHAELPHLASVDPRWQPDLLAPAGSLGDDAGLAAVLSGLAHLCGAPLGQGELRPASTAELTAAGERVLTLAEWRPHDPALDDLAGFPFTRPEPDDTQWWLRGTEHLDGGTASCWVPFSLVHAGYLAAGLDGQVPTNGHNLVGLEAGRDPSEALDRASGRLLAQDAVARWWHDSTDPLPSADVPPGLRGDGAAVTVRVLAVPSPHGVPVRLAVADDAGDGVVALGYGCAADPAAAAEQAVCEALIQHASARDLAGADSLIRRAPELGNGGVAGLAPYDPDRRYGEAFADRRRLIDPMCHVQYGLDPAVVAQVRQRTASAADTAGDAVAAGVAGSPFARLRSTPGRAVTVDVTTPRVRAAGYSVQRVLATGLRRLTVAAFPQHVDDGRSPYPGW